MISHQNQCIFVHQRKAAGTSVKSLFFDNAATGDLGYHQFNDGVLDHGYSRDNPIVSNYFKFTVVRNPWERFVSAWRYLECTKHRDIHEVLANLPSLHLLSDVLRLKASLPSRQAYLTEWLKKKQPLAKFHAKLVLRPGQKVARPNTSGEAFRHITRQQVASLFWPDGSRAVDHVIYHENLEDGLHEVATILGIKFTMIPHRNRNATKYDYRDFFNESSLADFGRIFAEDIRTWVMTLKLEKGLKKRGSGLTKCRWWRI